jgi:hypothetical protein
MNDPYASFRQIEKPGEAAHAQLDTLVMQLEQAEQDVTVAEAALKQAQERHRDICERQIPELMDEMGLVEFKNRNGLHVKIERKIRASIPAALRPAAYAWLENNGFGGMLKRTVSVAFNREEQDAARLLVGELEGKFAGVKEDCKVEPSTLSAFVREQLEQGSELPLELFGVFEQRIAKVK